MVVFTLIFSALNWGKHLSALFQGKV